LAVEKRVHFGLANVNVEFARHATRCGIFNKLNRGQAMGIGIFENAMALVVHVLPIGRDAGVGVGGHFCRPAL
jgi:hypothetical protein